MSTSKEIIRDEHRSMAAVLNSLTKQVTEAAAGKGPADLPLYGAMLDYLQAIPEVLHHPKEDQYLFRRLRERCPAAAPLLNELEAQHVSGAKTLANLRELLEEASCSGQVGPFADALNQYAQFQWKHMRMEEEQILPLADRELSAEDWAYLDAAFAVNRGPRW